MNSLRAKAGSGSASVVTPGGISVQHSGTSQEEYEITKRLKVDFHTLRSLLFGSDTRGVSLDLALRIQDEIKDDFIFITEEMVRQAFENSLTHYKFYGPQET
jgi:thermostable 8-oxoguanine DNA glycosylase